MTQPRMSATHLLFTAQRMHDARLLVLKGLTGPCLRIFEPSRYSISGSPAQAITLTLA